MIIIIIITSVYYCYYFYHKFYLAEKEKATGLEGGFTKKTVWTCLYACYLCTNFLFVCLFVVKNFCFLEFINCVCKFEKNKNKNLLKKIIKNIFLRNSFRK